MSIDYDVCFVQGYELRIQKLMEEMAALRKAITEREEVIGKLRIEVRETSLKIINVKVRAILQMYCTFVQYICA